MRDHIAKIRLEPSHTLLNQWTDVVTVSNLVQIECVCCTLYTIAVRQQLHGISQDACIMSSLCMETPLRLY